MKKPAKKPKTEDPDQSARFIAEARAIEADGGLSPTEAEKAFNELVIQLISKHAAEGDETIST